MFALQKLLFFCFVSWIVSQDSQIIERQNAFFRELEAQLNANNLVQINRLSCGFVNQNIQINCLSDLFLLTGISLRNLSLESIPTSIAGIYMLSSVTFKNAGLTALPIEFCKMQSLKSLDLQSNLLKTIPNEFSLLTLHALNLNGNPSLRISTELFKNMKQLKQLNVADTLVSGYKPDVVDTFVFKNSCISSAGTTPINQMCSCSSFFADFCPAICGVSSQQLCVDCSSLVTQQQCSGNCSWCSGKRGGFDCYWCDLEKNGCSASDPSICNVCSGFLVSTKCDEHSDCEWCKYGYCASTGECSQNCSNLSESECKSETTCSWCSSYQTCLDSTAQCLSCDRFTSSFCPPGCDCSSSSDSNSSVIIIVCVVCSVFFLICVGLLLLFVLKKNASKSSEMNSFLSSNTSLRFDDEFEMDEKSEHPIVSRYSECCVDSFFQVSQPILSFSSSGSPLKLCSPSTVTFEMKNVCGMELVVDCLFVKGFKEKHELVLSPSSFTIGMNEKQKISVELTMNCSATLTPSQSFICCGISTKQQWCSLCGIQAQSELSSLLSCDDIELKRELGRGSFGKVFLGSFKGTEVAVKMYSVITQEDNEKEANMFSKLHSPHIVTFYGISQTLNAMVIEYCKYGSVEGLFNRKEMNAWMRLLICYDCSLGMKYLHSSGIVHRDLKPDNLLIVSFSKDVNAVRAKISDFGTSRFGNQTMKMTESVGTPSYMAPEVFNNESYGKKSDVYSFGLTVWAIFSKQTPYSELPNVQTILLKVNEGYRPQLCQDCPLNDLIERCWQTNTSDRPSFDEITEILKQQI